MVILSDNFGNQLQTSAASIACQKKYLIELSAKRYSNNADFGVLHFSDILEKKSDSALCKNGLVSTATDLNRNKLHCLLSVA